MNRLDAFSAWLFTLLGVILLSASVLVVPERAFASHLSPDPCIAACCQALYGTSTCDQTDDFNACKSSCDNCVAAEGCDETCGELCVAQAGGLTNCSAKVCQGDDGGCKNGCGGQFCARNPTRTCDAVYAGCICPGP